jgi:RNA polymerase sigma-70 factor (ECF subfamily)
MQDGGGVRPEDLAARYDRVLREHGPALCRLAASYERDIQRRDDLFQEICLALWQALPRFRGEASERTFVFRVAHNRGITHRFRRPRVQQVDLDEAEDLPAPGRDPQEETMEGERRTRLEGALRALPLPYIQVLTLALEGLPAREIGEVLGLTENNVAVRLSRARGALRRLLEEGKGGTR